MESLTFIAMKALIVTSFSLVIFSFSYSQHKDIDKEIREVEEKRISAFRTKDIAALEKIWAPDYTVNRPAGVVSTRAKILELVQSDTISFKRIEFEIEQIMIKPQFVIVMGNETVEPSGKNPDAGKLLRRRYTHIWTNVNGNWVLTARHANVVCN